MNTRNRYIKYFRPLFLLLALLVTGSAPGWGQDTDNSSSLFNGYGTKDEPYQITNKVETDKPGNGQSYPVPVWETTIYVPGGGERELFIREILENLLEPDFFGIHAGIWKMKAMWICIRCFHRQKKLEQDQQKFPITMRTCLKKLSNLH